VRNPTRLVVAAVLSIVCAAALTAQPLPPPPNKTVIVIFENKDHDEIIGSCCAPYLNSLIQTGASLEFWAFHHPSQPNYYELFAGTIELKMQDGEIIRIKGDSCIQEKNKTLSVTPTLGDAFGEQFTGYAEDYDSTKPDFCPSAPSGSVQNDRRQFSNSEREMPYRRAVDEIARGVSMLSATILSFSSSAQRRRRPVSITPSRSS